MIFLVKEEGSVFLGSQWTSIGSHGVIFQDYHDVLRNVVHKIHNGVLDSLLCLFEALIIFIVGQGRK
jgi:hypothetical protein